MEKFNHGVSSALGEPEAIAKAISNIVAMENSPLRLILGDIGYAMVMWLMDTN